MAASTAAALATAAAPSINADSTLRQRNGAGGVSVKSTVHDDSSSSSGESDADSDVATFTPPAFTVKDLLGAIPKHCFERSALRSSAYLVGDFAMLAAFVYAATFIEPSFGFTEGKLVDGYAGRALRVICWAAYMFAAGSVGTGVWVIAHECGHQAFSTSKALNNSVGLVLHSALLVPYHSWRISHARHHAATGSMERDEVFVPKTRTQIGLKPAHEAAQEKKEETTMEKLDELFEDAPLYNLLHVIAQQTLGWPLYLIRNASGQNYGRWTNHYSPDSPIFDKRHFMQIVISDLGLAATLTALTLWGMNRGFAEVVKYYLVPYFIVNHHLVLITFLQHTDPQLPHYRQGEWTFPRGALCTIDRNLGGAIGAYVLHGICETHVAHHICSRIPHYHAWEVTEKLKEFLGDYYMYSEDNMYSSLYKSYVECRFVEDTGSCVFYKNRFGKAQRRVVYEEDSGVDVNSTVASGSDE